MYYTFKDNRDAVFCAYLPNSKEAEKFASAIIIEDNDNSTIAEALRTVYFD